MKKFWNRIILIDGKMWALLLAIVLYSVYQFYPMINQFIILSFLMYVPFIGMLAYLVVPWIVAVALCAAIAIIYWLAGVRNSIFVATASFSASYVLVSWLIVLFALPTWVGCIGGIVVAIVLFTLVLRFVSKIKLSTVLAVIVSAVCLGVALYVTPLITNPIQVQRSIKQADNTFQLAVKNINFVPYYPTYHSAIYPMTAPKLNGYEKNGFNNETVTFSSGVAEVKEGTYLQGQDKIMNFTDNCTIYQIWFAVNNDTSIKQRDIDADIQNPQACTLLSITPSGKKVYFVDDGDDVYFYVLLDRTNFMIHFYNVLQKNYNPNYRDEIVKIIDSLRPLKKADLQDGISLGSEY